MSARALVIESSLGANVDPIFGAPLSLPERLLWQHILNGGGKRRGWNWREQLDKLLRGISFASPTSPFGAGSGGAGGNVTTAQAQALAKGDTPSFGNSYPWLYPTSDFINFDKYGTVALPAIGATAGIGGTVSGAAITNNAASSLPFVVPVGYNGFVKTMALDFVANAGAAWTQGVLPPQLQFGMSVSQGSAYDYGTFFFSPGTVPAPSPLAGIPIKEQQIVQMFVTNLTLTQTTQFVEARLQGYYYGKTLEPTSLAY
jgi:hypothetical protein